MGRRRWHAAAAVGSGELPPGYSNRRGSGEQRAHHTATRCDRSKHMHSDMPYHCLLQTRSYWSKRWASASASATRSAGHRRAQPGSSCSTKSPHLTCLSDTLIVCVYQNISSIHLAEKPDLIPKKTQSKSVRIGTSMLPSQPTKKFAVANNAAFLLFFFPFIYF